MHRVPPPPDDIAACALHTYYHTFPSKAKPHVRSDGRREWTCFAAIVLSFQGNGSTHLECVAAGAGVKCLPDEAISCHGDVLHDLHAEILARRAFNLWIRHQLSILFSNESLQSESLRSQQWFVPCNSDNTRWKFNSCVGVHMYVSTLSCGDMSMTSIALQQDPQEAQRYGNQSATCSILNDHLSRGRKGYAHVGRIRTKPGRPDSPLSTSMSCADKLALYSFIGLQDSLLAQLIDAVYLDSITFSGVADTRTEDVRTECVRALHGRFTCNSLLPDDAEDQHHHPIIQFTRLSFRDSREYQTDSSNLVATSDAFNYVKDAGIEVLTDGIKKGSALTKRKPLSQNESITEYRQRILPVKQSSRSRVCKSSVLQSHLDLLRLCHFVSNVIDQNTVTYRQLKENIPWEGWRRACHRLKKEKLMTEHGGPLYGWIRSDPALERFTIASR